MWPNQTQFWCDPFLLNFIYSSFNTPYVQQPFQPTSLATKFSLAQQTPSHASKSYRDTLDEIEQKSDKKGQNPRRKRMDKASCIFKKEREDNFERKRQKKDRNLPSNICKHLVSYLYHHPHPQTYLQTPKDSQTSRLLYSCIQKMKSHIKESQTYIRPGLLQSMCRTDLLGQAQAALLRAVFKKYINVEFRLTISMMRKLTKKEKLAYFKMGRKFAKKFTTNI